MRALWIFSALVLSPVALAGTEPPYVALHNEKLVARDMEKAFQRKRGEPPISQLVDLGRESVRVQGKKVATLHCQLQHAEGMLFAAVTDGNEFSIGKIIEKKIADKDVVVFTLNDPRELGLVVICDEKPAGHQARPADYLGLMEKGGLFTKKKFTDQEQKRPKKPTGGDNPDAKSDGTMHLEWNMSIGKPGAESLVTDEK